ncbi:MAG TPA: Dabb family protein [Candidatus Sumerlaeota bacterium]|nr:Dabb family protein [Candidatus Sumerlaeota bacterium]HPK03976.1 Dabb family protein [Candidatus Sumerlaeota bacterium]
MVNHIVLLKVRANVRPEIVEGLFGELEALRDKIPGITSFTGGPYSGPKGINKGFTHGFIMRFSDAGARDVYMDHPEHEVVKVRLREVLEAGPESLVAFDFEG